MLKSLILFTFLCIYKGTFASSAEVNFNYHERGPTTWWFFHPEQCDDLLFPIQSPIALSSQESLSANIKSIVMTDYNEKPNSVRLLNDGTSLIMVPSFSNPDQAAPSVKGGSLIPGEQYRLDHIIWHWGENSTVGGEHVIDGISSPMEMQMVHYNSRLYKSFEEALAYENGVVIMAFQYVISEIDNAAYQFFLQSSKDIREAGLQIELGQDILPNVAALFDGVDVGEFFSYHGSLTRPPCSNTVTWIVFPSKIDISVSQLDLLRTLQDTQEKAITRNYRDLQKIFGRKPIFHSSILP